MKKALILLIFIATSSTYSQSKIGRINDVDGFVNVRVDKSAKSEILGKIKEDEYFTYFEINDSNWWLVESSNGLIGFMHKSRISFIKDGYVDDKLLRDYKVKLSLKEQSLNDVSIKIIQLSPVRDQEMNVDDFHCKGLIRTIKTNRLINETNYDQIEPVGSDFGIAFSKEEPFDNYFIASKFGDYQGELIIVHSNGYIQRVEGGQYFITKDKKFIVSPWSSDLSGLTIIDMDKNKVRFNRELDIYLGDWYLANDTYFAPEWDGNQETKKYYQIDFNSFEIVQSKLTKDQGQIIDMIENECYCD